MTTDLAKKQETIAMQTTAASTSRNSDFVSIDSIVAAGLPERNAPVLKIVPDSGEHRELSLADAYLSGNMTLSADPATIAQRVNNFMMAHARTYPEAGQVHKYGIGHRFGDLYAAFADAVTPDEFVDMHKAAYDPFKGIFANEAWDIQTRKLSHTEKDGRGRTYLVPFTEQETSAARDALDKKRFEKLHDILTEMRFAKVHDKITDYLTAHLKDEASDLPYVKNRADKNRALRELIGKTCQACKGQFEQMWTRERRYANYLDHIEEAVMSDLETERKTGSHYRQKALSTAGTIQEESKQTMNNIHRQGARSIN